MLKRIEKVNAPAPGILPNVRVEVTIKQDEYGKVTLIVRDDGRIFAIEDVGVPVKHVPATGFNRNVVELVAVEGERKQEGVRNDS